ncbi:hypothetical protein M0R72_17620 [Candidatus Pacearchaeota archaeon]|jgi:hypothetical protein|nr:hypothetical protein [Candidatus Pacearchaeota archaeon]
MTLQRPEGIAALKSRPLRLPRAGRARLGEKEVNDNDREYPRELDYLNLTDAPAVVLKYAQIKIDELNEALRRDLDEAKQEQHQKQLQILQGLLAKVQPGKLPDEKTAKALSKALKCRELDIIFPINDKRSIADTCYMRYGASGPKCRGNGVTAWDMEAGAEIDCFGEECEHAMGDRPSCKRQMILTFVCYRVPGLCVDDLVTSGWRSIENTLAFLDTLESLFGRIDGIPLKMYREPYETSRKDKDGKRKRQIHHCIRLDLEASLLDVKRLQLGGPMELPPTPAECADDMYPKSLQEAEKALPPGPVIEAPIAAVPDPEPAVEPDPDPPADESDEVKDIIEGFKLCGIPEVEWPQFFNNYEGRLPELQSYLSNLLDSQMTPVPEPTIEGSKPKGRCLF